MSETINTVQHYYTKDFGAYKQSEDNFVANQELTVTITLNEYRKLISESAQANAKIEEANKNKFIREEENRKLKEEIARLKGLLYEKTVVEPVEEETV
ncbi:hypothetical protein [Lysinibacillus sp. FSL W8-0992]|uniref:hypothetical protein n=1 Tax=Lysinibacillus sp. FSL W8-0992 TaxID=2954643 RepID=UPI0030F6DF24